MKTELGFFPAMFDKSPNLLTECIEGPYYIEPPTRKDIRDGHPKAIGKRLELGLRLINIKTGEPASDALVDIWSCNAQGFYSGFEYVNPDEPPNNPGDMRPQTDANWLRGRQPADQNGIAEFETVYPSWYSTRVPHIHIKVWLNGNCVLTSQLYFPNEYTEKLIHDPEYLRDAEPDADLDTDFVRFMMGYDGGAMLNLRKENDLFRAWAAIAFEPDARSTFKPMTPEIWETIPTNVGTWRDRVPRLSNHYADMKRRGK